MVSKILSEFDTDVPTGDGGSSSRGRKRKRGRPPLQSGPLECDQCDMKFEMVKEMRRHLVRTYTDYRSIFEVVFSLEVVSKQSC